jgi:4-hydroxy-tetrahydrodipicolinate reductase
MNQKQIKVVQYGLGPIGLLITKYLLERKIIKIVGAIDIDPHKVGKDLGTVAGLDKKLGVQISPNAYQVLKHSPADIVVLTTTSSLKTIKSQILQIILHGKNVVSTCEELVYPWLTNSKIAKEIDLAAKKKKVSVLSTGVNPGFLMDFLPMAVTAVCKEVNNITVERIQNAKYRRIPFQQKIGAGLTINEFDKKVKDGTLRHVGLTESIHLIAAKLGWKLDKTQDIIEPVVAAKNISTGKMKIAKGNALGVQQTGLGIKNNEEKIKLLFRATIGEKSPRDRIVLDSVPPIDMTIKNGVNGDIATCAITINAIPIVINAKSGLRTMADVEPISCFI